jgi:molybdate transport system substrate-binding protein
LWALTQLTAVACRSEVQGQRPLVVFAAASLAKPFQAIAQAFEQQNPTCKVQLNLEGTPALVLKLQQGVRADVLATADPIHMQKVTAAGLAAGEACEFARNRLAIVVAEGNPRGIHSLADLARTDLKVALCGPEVPAGRYARQCLEQAAVVVHSVSDETSVLALCGKVRLREVDAGIAYATDAQAAGLQAVAIPAEHNVTTSYPIVRLVTGPNPDDGDRFVAFVRSHAGQTLLAAAGWITP